LNISTIQPPKLPSGDTATTTKEINLCRVPEFNKIRGPRTPWGNFRSPFRTGKCGYYEKPARKFSGTQNGFLDITEKCFSETCQLKDNFEADGMME
jgi:hypothetical protein